MRQTLLEIKNLSIAFKYEDRYYTVIRDVNFKLNSGEILGLVGESGSGKSVTSKAILRLLPKTSSKILDGEIIFEGRDILKMPLKDMFNIRGNKISMIFQEPMTSLNPVFTCGDQIMEAIILHQRLSKKEAYQKACNMMKLVGIPMPEQRMKNYPHEMSGGMRQRVMIAMALACNPSILIADEPTTALDPTIQAQITELIQRLRVDIGMSVIYISHDLGVIAENCDRVVVLYLGAVMEIADVKELFANPLHPYTQGLLACVPDIDRDVERLPCIEGNVPHLTEIPEGCPFATRCSYADDICRTEFPGMYGEESHLVRCFRYK